MVDAQIGVVLKALRDSGQVENTVVIFTSDHGDHDGAHKLEHKGSFYEEAIRVPLIISQAGTTPSGVVDDGHLVSNGLDLLPTVCDYAGAAVPGELEGVSLRPLAEGRDVDEWRSRLAIECVTGRMVMSPRYKYMLYDSGAHREQLIDRVTDPGEMRNAAQDADKADVLAAHRALFEETFPGWGVVPAG
jgi:arylsulfatase A-like enzyme